MDSYCEAVGPPNHLPFTSSLYSKSLFSMQLTAVHFWHRAKEQGIEVLKKGEGDRTGIPCSIALIPVTRVCHYSFSQILFYYLVIAS